MHDNIIPHNDAFTQVSLYQNGDKLSLQSHIDYAESPQLTPVQAAAYELYDSGLNVFPQPLGSKGGYPWKRLQYTRLNRDHRSYGLLRLFAGECNLAVMCGHTSGNLFVIDCETPEALAFHMAQLRRRNIPLWVVQTARGGHIYLRALEGEVHNIDSGVIQNVEVRGRRGYVLAPPAVHPTGAVYSWLEREGDTPPDVRINQIDWLQDVSGRNVGLKADAATAYAGAWSLGIVSPYSLLAKETTAYIQHGHTIAEGSRNNSLFKAACDLCGNDYSQTEATAMLLPPARGSGLGDREIHTTIASAYSQPRDPARPHHMQRSDEARNSSVWKHALLYASNRPWSGRGSGAERALFLALVERARLSCSSVGIFRGSIRELAAMARIGTATVQRIIRHWLKENTPRIAYCGRDAMSGASLWRFSDAVLSEGRRLERIYAADGIPRHWLTYGIALFRSDAVERGALGHGGMFVYRFLLSMTSPMLPAEIAEASGLTINQVNYALRKLRDYGLVQRLPRGWFARQIEDEDLDRHVGAIGRGAARRARFRAEREVFAGRLLFDARLRTEGERLRVALNLVMVWRYEAYQHAPAKHRQCGDAAYAASRQEKAARTQHWSDDRIATRQRGIPDPGQRAAVLPDHIRDDDLLILALELGAVIHLDDGTFVDATLLTDGDC